MSGPDKWPGVVPAAARDAGVRKSGGLARCFPLIAGHRPAASGETIVHSTDLPRAPADLPRPFFQREHVGGPPRLTDAGRPASAACRPSSEASHTLPPYRADPGFTIPTGSGVNKYHSVQAWDRYRMFHNGSRGGLAALLALLGTRLVGLTQGHDGPYAPMPRRYLSAACWSIWKFETSVGRVPRSLLVIHLPRLPSTIFIMASGMPTWSPNAATTETARHARSPTSGGAAIAGMRIAVPPAAGAEGSTSSSHCVISAGLGRCAYRRRSAWPGVAQHDREHHPE
jgi:hypothetical protein